MDGKIESERRLKLYALFPLDTTDPVKVDRISRTRLERIDDT